MPENLWKVISVALLIKEGKVLLGLREREGNLWEFPGGSVEKGENPEETVIRELKEELNIQVLKSEMAGVLCDWKASPFRIISFFYVWDWKGEVQNICHEELDWFTLEDCLQKKIPNINPDLFDKITDLIGKGIRLSS